ncbi:hypothetical protein OAR04_02745 [Flavobacteriales bacterium]|nr:hypothetical protein [Flavobacteriales bacterium]
MAQKQLPEWIDGYIYDEGGEVTGRSSQEVLELNNIELSIYDAVVGTSGSYPNEKNKLLVKEGIQWFKENNTKAHQILLEEIEYFKGKK